MSCPEEATGDAEQFAASALKLLDEGDQEFQFGRLAAASAAYERAIALEPRLPQAHHNLGVVLRRLGRLNEAEASYRSALALRPGAPETHNNLGNVLRELGRPDEAVASYRQALAFSADDPEILNNLGAALQAKGDLADAIGVMRRALALSPAAAETLSNLVNMSKLACDWRDLAEYEERCRAMVRAGGNAISPAHFLAIPSSLGEQLDCARHWARKRSAGTGTLPAPERKTDGRIRLGYISAKFFQHASAYLAAQLFECHDRAAFEVNAYSIGPDDRSPMRRRLEQAFDRFVDLRALSHADAAQRIRDDGIDILIDLTGYHNDERMPILAWRPAAVQVNFLGPAGTMGADFVDYIIADPYNAPMTDQPFYAERIVHLPDCFQPNDRRREIAHRTPTRAECGLPASGFVFCGFHQPYKIGPRFFDIWMSLLQALPGSVLWLLDTNQAVRTNLGREAEARGVAAERLVFAPMLPLAEHLARHRLADLFLDTLPVNALTTASDALWAGLPVLTCSGDTMAGRGAGSLLHAVGLPDLITHSTEEYRSLALMLATDPARLGDLRRRLAANRLSTPLFDSARFTRHLEAAYRRMWEIWSGGRSPEPFAIAPQAPILPS